MKLRRRRRTEWFQLRAILTNLLSKKFQRNWRCNRWLAVWPKNCCALFFGILAKCEIGEWIMVSLKEKHENIYIVLWVKEEGNFALFLVKKKVGKESFNTLKGTMLKNCSMAAFGILFKLWNMNLWICRETVSAAFSVNTSTIGPHNYSQLIFVTKNIL